MNTPRFGSEGVPITSTYSPKEKTNKAHWLYGTGIIIALIWLATVYVYGVTRDFNLF